MPREYKEIKVASQISDLLNNMSLSTEEIAKAMTMEHKTLQQTFTQLCIGWLKVCASDDYRHDGRNEFSHFIAKEIKIAYDKNHTDTSVEFFNDIMLPYI